MKIVVVSHSGNKTVISADMQGELKDPKTGAVMSVGHSFNSSVVIESKQLVISFIGDTVIKGVFFKSLLNGFKVYLESLSSDIDIKEAQTHFYKYFKQHWSEIFSAIMKQHIIFVKYLPDKTIVDSICFSEEEGMLVRHETKETVLIDENTLIINDDRTTTIIPADLPHSTIFGQMGFLQGTRVSMYSIEINRLANECRKTQSFYGHQFKYVDDYIAALQVNNFGSTLCQPYTRAQLDSVLETPASDLLKKPEFERVFTFKQFWKICRNNMDTTKADEYYRNIFFFINDAARVNPIFKRKLQRVIAEGLLMQATHASNLGSDNEHHFAFYNLKADIIFINYDKMELFPFYQQIRVFQHEVEHALQAKIHAKRWLTAQIYSFEQESFANQYNHSLPYFPYDQEQKSNFASNYRLARKRIEKLLELLNISESQHSDEQKQYLTEFEKAKRNYRPFVNIERLSEDNKSRVRSGTTGTITLGGYTTKTLVINILQRDKVTSSLQIHSDAKVGLLFDILNQMDNTKNDFCELQARMIGELPNEVLALLFPEMLRYAAEDYAAAFPEDTAEYLALSQRYTEEFQSKLFKDKPIAPNNLIAHSVVCEAGNQHNALLQALQRKVEEMPNFKDKFIPFLTSIEQNSYLKALATLCVIKPTQDHHRGALLLLEIMLSKKEGLFDVTALYNNKPLLYYAAVNGGRDMFDLLVKAGADANATFNDKNLQAYLDDAYPQTTALQA